MYNAGQERFSHCELDTDDEVTVHLDTKDRVCEEEGSRQESRQILGIKWSLRQS